MYQYIKKIIFVNSKNSLKLDWIIICPADCYEEKHYKALENRLLAHHFSTKAGCINFRANIGDGKVSFTTIKDDGTRKEELFYDPTLTASKVKYLHGDAYFDYVKKNQFYRHLIKSLIKKYQGTCYYDYVNKIDVYLHLLDSLFVLNFLLACKRALKKCNTTLRTMLSLI